MFSCHALDYLKSWPASHEALNYNKLLYYSRVFIDDDDDDNDQAIR